MPEYQWRGVNYLQRRQSGTLIAGNRQQAQTSLLQKGIQNIVLKRNWRLYQRVKMQDVAHFIQQLALLLEAGIPIKQSIDILLSTLQNEKLYRWLQHIKTGIETGYSFSHMLYQYPDYLLTSDRQLIKIAEKSGRLTTILKQLAESKQASVTLQRKLHKILLYPVIVLTISLTLTLLLLMFAVPQFTQMYQSQQQALPFFTQLLVDISTLLKNYWGRLSLLTVMSCFGGYYFYRYNHRFKARLQIIGQYLPVIGTLIKLNRTVQMTQNLALMLSGGIPLDQAIATLIEHSDNKTSHELSQTKLLVEQGYPLSQSLSTQLLDQSAQQMLIIGEQSGKVVLMLEHIASQQKQQLIHRIDLLSELLEPLLMLVIVGIIAIIMLGLYLPLFNMGSMF